MQFYIFYFISLKQLFYFLLFIKTPDLTNSTLKVFPFMPMFLSSSGASQRFYSTFDQRPLGASQRVCAPKPSRVLSVVWKGSSRFLGPTSERLVQTPPSVHRGAIWDFDLYLFHIFSPSIEWKASKYGVISGQYFPVFRLNTERYVTPYLDTFHAVIKWAYAVVKLKLS